jgi:threonine/homoserine efflux transporter RhtA
MLFLILFTVLLSVLLSAFYFFVAGIPLWLVVLMIFPGALLIAVVIGGAENENT